MYNSTTDQLENLSRLSNPYRYGGMRKHKCRHIWSSSPFAGFYIKPANAQGDTSYWRDTQPDGDDTPSNGPLPVARPFYSFWLEKDGKRFEYRYFHRADTGFLQTLYAIRPEHVDSRTSLQWKKRTGEWLCDFDIAGRGC